MFGRRRPAVLPHNDLRFILLDKFLANFVPPASISWSNNISSWGVMLNTSIGCCVAACLGHFQELWSSFTQVSPIVLTDAQILAQYERVGNYNPANPATDKGEYISAALADWLVNLVGNNKCSAYAAITPSNTAAWQSAVAQLGGICVGINFPKSGLTQFNAGQPWTPVANDPILAGHCVLILGYDANWIYCVTWGKIQLMSYAWFAQYVEEAWAVVDILWLLSTGLSPSGLNLTQLLSLVNPPAPTPVVPTPEPTPIPTPTPPEPNPNLLIFDTVAKTITFPNNGSWVSLPTTEPPVTVHNALKNVVHNSEWRVID